MTKPVLRYRYDVAGRTFIGFRVAFSGYGADRPSMEQLIKPYPVGSAVQVYYDPRDPSSAVLDNSSASDWRYWFGFGLGFFALGFYLAGR